MARDAGLPPTFNDRRLATAIAAGVVLAALAAPAGAAPSRQNLKDLTSAARHWLAASLSGASGRPPHIDIQPPDPRLQLPRCGHPHFSRLHPSARSGRIALRATCGHPAWQLYLIARVQRRIRVVIARHPLAAGQHLTRADVTRDRRNQSSLPPNAVTSLQAAVGHVLMHSLAAGSPVTGTALALPTVVRRGDRLTIVAQGDGLSLSAAGVALENGRPGQRILVRNPSSGRILHATVTGPHRVKVTF